MKIVDLFKGSKVALISGTVFFCSVMLLISCISLRSLPDVDGHSALASFLGVVGNVCAVAAAVSIGVFTFVPLKARFGTGNAVFILIYFYEILTALAGAVIFALSFAPQSSPLYLGFGTSFLYFFEGILLFGVALAAAVVTSVVFVVFTLIKNAKARSAEE